MRRTRAIPVDPTRNMSQDELLAYKKDSLRYVALASLPIPTRTANQLEKIHGIVFMDAILDLTRAQLKLRVPELGDKVLHEIGCYVLAQGVQPPEGWIKPPPMQKRRRLKKKRRIG